LITVGEGPLALHMYLSAVRRSSCYTGRRASHLTDLAARPY